MTKDQDGVPMRRSGVIVRRAREMPSAAVVAAPRIGITKAADWPLRFVLDGSPWLSRPLPA
jgi:DNA-3-methyladenine glycosylase